jgi:hypothetical protein
MHFNSMPFAEQNSLVLKAIIDNYQDWRYDKEFSKIVEKMKKGKKLKKKEFTKIHWFLWGIGR